MADSHKYSFFGQNIGLLISSSSKHNPFIYMQCIKRKSGGNWEKPSNGEGRVIKFSLEEIISILCVLNHKKEYWKSNHFYNDMETKIHINWEDKKYDKLWITVANYSKLLNYAQAEILKILLKHILEEKIQFSTSSSKKIDV
ncbi:MAG: hypothetical protein KGD57_02780 [Candidatus Lokiarchaeota archaeon]|nr:hypothetical protein [Candidatus Lokiarchaeota archaeon]